MLIGCWNNATRSDWLSETPEVESTYSSRGGVLVFMNDLLAGREGSILLSFLLFCGLMVGKYALICAMEIQKIHMVVHIFSGFALLWN